ncbi:glycosyltransferase [bacterium]|jgi:glycosyltransferase involved in cell wall biosynthesis|nr:glycosyltransferase [bacterium]
MRNIVDQWIEANKTSRNFLEQKNLENVLDKNKEIKIFNFPASYCQIFDIMNNTATPVIEHFQSSRKWRKNIDTMKKISIIMPTYNQDKFIKESIDSILNQTFENWELIIVNDGSTDNTKKILDEQNDPRIQIIHKENEGTGSALNMGFETATGEYETWLASDNKYYPNALQDMFDILESKKDIDFVYCNCEIGVMDSTGLGEITRKNYNSEVPMEWNAHNFYEHYNIGVIWLWRKELRISAGKSFILEPCEDYEMTTRMIEAGGKFYYHPIVSGWHRRHNENLTKKLTTSGNYIPTLMEKMKKKRNKLSNTEEIFTKIYQHNKWRGTESKSGKGSDSIQTSELISALPAFFKKWGLKIIVDAACGDWNWMSKIIPNIEFDKYTGIDIVGDLIQNNNKNFTNDKIQFKQKNIILYPLEEKADVILSRDTLNHFSDKDALNALDHFIHSGTTYILITNFGKHRENTDIMTGNWRPICFENAPFNFPEPLDRIMENCTEKDSSGSYEDKHLALWKLEDIYTCIRKSQQIPDYRKNVVFNILTDAIRKQLESASNPPPEKKDNSNWHLTKIPKRAYFYWGGIMPYFRYLTLYSFCKMNPDWEVILYYPKYTTKTNTWVSTEHCYDLNCPDYFGELKKLPITLKEFDGKDLGIPNEYPEVWKSDFLRWHLLGQDGGVWLDMDILFNKPMNYLDLNNPQNKDLDTIVSISEIFAPATFHSIGFMASAPKNDYYRYVMSKAIRTRPDFTNYQANGVVLLNTEFPTLNHIRKKFPNLKVDSISFNTVYAYYPMQYIKEIFTPGAPNRLKSHSLGIHWYAGHPSAGEFTNKLTPDNYMDFIDAPIGKILYEVLSK